MSKFKVGDMLVRVDNNSSWAPAGWCVELKEVGFYIDKNGCRTVLIDSLWKLVSPKAKKILNPPHVHKDLIIAWANGAEIQFELPDGWLYESTPSWFPEYIYRIKPTKTSIELKIEKCEAKLAKLKGQL